jgi:hypothetical protein
MKYDFFLAESLETIKGETVPSRSIDHPMQ